MAQYSSVDEIIDEVGQCARETLDQLIQRWSVMHLMSDKVKHVKFMQFMDYTKEFFKDLVDSQEKKKLELIGYIEDKMKEHSDLQKELKTQIDLNIDESAPLDVVLVKVDNSLKEFRELKERRMQKYQKLIQEEIDLCRYLGIEVMEKEENFPSEADLEAVEQRIFDLQQDKCEREQEVIETRERISTILKLLEKEPVLSFEKEVFSDKFPVTTVNMSKLKNWEDALKAELKTANENKNMLLDKLKRLWDRIRVEENYRELFLASNQGVGKTAFRHIHEELDRCEEIKLANIRPLIQAARKELEMFWDRCMYSEEEKRQFLPYSTEMYNDDILELHELEIDALKHYHQSNLPLFEAAAQWEELWERVLHLEEMAKDKNRLFNNRGGQLLKEEKERKLLEKKLPKVHSELVALLQEYRESMGKPFKWKGEDLLERITAIWEERENQEEPIKKPTRANSNNNLTRSAQKSHAGLRTPNKTPMKAIKSRPATPLVQDLSATSIASYTLFQEQMNALCAAPTKTPQRTLRSNLTSHRKPLGEVNSPISKRSSPLRSTPVKRQCPTQYSTTPYKKVCRTPVSTSKSCTPLKITSQSRKGTPSRQHLTTPRSTSKLRTPRTLPRLTPARSKFTFDL